jgi:hypothetical protein
MNRARRHAASAAASRNLFDATGRADMIANLRGRLVEAVVCRNEDHPRLSDGVKAAI